MRSCLFQNQLSLSLSLCVLNKQGKNTERKLSMNRQVPDIAPPHPPSPPPTHPQKREKKRKEKRRGVLVFHLICHRLVVVQMSFCSLLKGINRKTRMCFVLINSVLLSLACVWKLSSTVEWKHPPPALSEHENRPGTKPLPKQLLNTNKHVTVLMELEAGHSKGQSPRSPFVLKQTEQRLQQSKTCPDTAVNNCNRAWIAEL